MHNTRSDSWVALDLRSAWRGLAHSPCFTLVVLTMLTVGIGLSTTVFSLVRGILLEPLPYPRADRLVRIAETSAGGPIRASAEWTGVRNTSLGTWFALPTALSHIAAYGSNETVVSLPDGAASVFVASVSGQFFSTLGAPPAAGRVLQAADAAPEAPATAVISERLAWRSFGGPQEALGRSLAFERRAYTVVGVMAAGFSFPGRDVDVWYMGREYAKLPAPGTPSNFGFRTRVIARLGDGSTVADAGASGEQVAATLAAADAALGLQPPEGQRFRVTRLHDEVVAPVRPALLVLAGGMALVLLALIVTLVALLLARNTARQRELAVRRALGASRWRVGRPVLLELILLAAAGGAGGTLVAWGLLRALPALAPADLPRLESIGFDARTLLLAVVSSLATAVAAGWLPLLQVGSLDVGELTAAGARVRLGRLRRTADQLRGALVVAQVAMAVVLLVGALLVGRSLATLMQVRLGYQPEQVLTFQAAHQFDTARQEGRLRGYYDELLRRLSAHPAVRSAGTATTLPLHQVRSRSSVLVVGRPRRAGPVAEEDMAVNQRVSHDYLRTIGARIVAGRGFDERDHAASEPVVLVDEVLARRFFPDGDAIGQQLRGGRRNLTIVGIVEAVRVGALAEDPPPVIYHAGVQEPEFLAYFGAGVAVRGDGDPRALAPIVHQIAREIDPRVPLYNVRPLREAIRGNVAQPRFFTLVVGLFAALALATAVLGIYGVLAYAVERRRLEFGIRRALGAADRQVIALVVRRGLALAAAGAALGLAAAAWGARFLRALLFGIAPDDPWSYAAAATLVLALAFIASWQPAWSALRVDPARALRVE